MPAAAMGHMMGAFVPANYDGLERVEVKWGGTWWAAVILKSRKGRTYIHYLGYGSGWDEWVGAERLRRSALTPAR